MLAYILLPISGLGIGMMGRAGRDKDKLKLVRRKKNETFHEIACKEFLFEISTFPLLIIMPK